MADNNDTSPPPPSPEDENSIDSPPPPKTSSSPPPPPSPPASPPPPPPETKTSPPPPSKSKDSPPPPEATPPPPDTSPPPPPSPSKEVPTSPPPPEKNNNSPPANSNPPPAASNPPPKQSHTIPSPEKLPSFSPLVPPAADKEPPLSLPPHLVGSSPNLKTSDSPHLNSQTNSSSSSNNNNLVVVIAGASVAGVLILALIIVCFVCCKRKKKRPYYYDQERQHNDQFYNGTTEWNNTPHSMDHVVKFPTPPVGNGGGNGQWGVTPSPHPNYSSDYNHCNSGQHPPSRTPSPMGGLGSSQSQFSYDDLARATAGFSQANLLGQGGFGYVYKGVLPDGKVVAVKSLKSGSGQGEREFQAEVEIISRVHHRHLVSLVGYCITNDQRMLVYEFVANQTMEHHLHGKGQPVMDWSSRVRIAIGSAKGLAYLHEDCHPRIIHRDIKAANILLDENYEAMVADFGLAKLTTDNFTHVSTRVMGTFGYLAPEYASSGKLSEKSDVFSFGVMLLELITGHRPVDLTGETMEDSLADWARPLLAQALEDENYNELVDPRLEGNYSLHELASMISCASASIRHSAKRRPKMSQIVRALEGDSILVEETSEVRKSSQRHNNVSTSHDSAYDTVAYNADMMKFRNMVMNNQDNETSSEYGATSEYGLNPSSSTSSNNSRELGAHTGQKTLKY